MARNDPQAGQRRGLRRALLAAALLGLLLAPGCIKVVSVPDCPTTTAEIRVTLEVPFIVPATATLEGATCTPPVVSPGIVCTPAQVPVAPTATLARKAPAAIPPMTPAPRAVVTCPPQPCVTATLAPTSAPARPTRDP